MYWKSVAGAGAASQSFIQFIEAEATIGTISRQLICDPRCFGRDGQLKTREPDDNWSLLESPFSLSLSDLPLSKNSPGASSMNLGAAFFLGSGSSAPLDPAAVPSPPLPPPA